MFGKTLGLSALIAVVAGSALAQPVVTTLSGGVGGMSRDGSVVYTTTSFGLYRYQFGGTFTVNNIPMDNAGGGGRCDDTGNIITGSKYNGEGANAVYPGILSPNSPVACTWTWPSSSAWLPCAPLSGAGTCSTSISTPYDISGDGRYVVGLIWVGGCTVARAYVSDLQLNTTTNLGGLNGFNKSTRANCISGTGEVIGGFDTNAFSGSRLPAVWRRNAASSTGYSEVLLKNLGGTTSTGGEVYGCNRGTATVPEGKYVVGWTFNADNTSSLCRWEYNTTTQTYVATALQTRPAATAGAFGTARCSDDGSVVVFGSYDGNAYIWDATNGARNLFNLMSAQGATGITNTYFQYPVAISGNGRKIAGQTFLESSWIIDLDGGTSACIGPAITIGPSSNYTSVSGCDSVIFNSVAAGTAPFTYQWYKQGSPATAVVDGYTPWGSQITGGATSQMRVYSPRPADAGSYYCVVTSVCNPSLSTQSGIGVIGTNPAYANGAPNDTCATAKNVGEGMQSFSLCNSYVDETPQSCLPLNIISTQDLWFRYTPTFTGMARMSTCDATNWWFDSVVAVYDSCDGNLIGCNDDVSNSIRSCNGGGNRSSAANVPVTAGVPVFVRVSSVGVPFDQTKYLTITRQSTDTVGGPVPGPANDNCVNATPAVLGLNFFDNFDATNDGLSSCYSVPTPDVWFKWTAPSSGRLNIGTCGASFDTTLSIRVGCNGTDIQCSDDVIGTLCGSTSPTVKQSRIENINVTGGTEYTIRIGSQQFMVGVTGPYDSRGWGQLEVAFVSTSCNAADIATLGTGLGAGGGRNPDGANTVDDLIAFLSAFFSGNAAAADFVTVGGNPTPDGNLTADDLIYFLSQFFAPCN